MVWSRLPSRNTGSGFFPSCPFNISLSHTRASKMIAMGASSDMGASVADDGEGGGGSGVRDAGVSDWSVVRSLTSALSLGDANGIPSAGTGSAIDRLMSIRAANCGFC
ncbi:hypothetical protein L202_04696 [Cryptococcus amylolentus CBS 6039]|uniref:Uncharacterized protein n=1 Tax=Cryptococcus amylolentus CBS 6039 TaxID=1295533 RepID=A0A1E3HME3_9TREE|nr:hypothetical protein L202_04696 [Cryptococcus amylolentus CBS 6039]ODN77523.1 hypothetical protein L202_04696 [Cryptococcus amylolentus CBS 6039]